MRAAVERGRGDLGVREEIDSKKTKVSGRGKGKDKLKIREKR